MVMLLLLLLTLDLPSKDEVVGVGIGDFVGPFAELSKADAEVGWVTAGRV